MSLRRLILPASGSPPFSPTDIAGLRIFYDPRSGITKDGSDRVSNWADQSGNGNDAVQATDANKFVFTASQFGSNPGLVATAANSQRMTLTSAITGLTAFTAVVVLKPATDVIMQPMGYVSGGIFSTPHSGNGYISEAFDGANYADFNDTISTGTAYAWIIKSGANPAAAVATRNGSALTSAGTVGSAWLMGLSHIGSTGIPGRFTNGAIGPILLYDTSLSAGNITNLTSWLTSNGWY
jgi:hypothetical protein